MLCPLLVSTVISSYHVSTTSSTVYYITIFVTSYNKYLNINMYIMIEILMRQGIQLFVRGKSYFTVYYSTLLHRRAWRHPTVQ